MMLLFPHNDYVILVLLSLFYIMPQTLDFMDYMTVESGQSKQYCTRYKEVLLSPRMYLYSATVTGTISSFQNNTNNNMNML